MSDLKVRIVDLEPMRVVYALGSGPSPEEMAWARLRQWAEAHGLLADVKAHRFFGFNNPSPSPGSPDYGYEQWMTVAGATPPGEGMQAREFPGGRYAVTRCQLKHITEAWGELAAWCERGQHPRDRRQWLEECLTPEAFLTEPAGDPGEALFDMYLPIAE